MHRVQVMKGTVVLLALAVAVSLSEGTKFQQRRGQEQGKGRGRGQGASTLYFPTAHRFYNTNRSLLFKNVSLPGNALTYWLTNLERNASPFFRFNERTFQWIATEERWSYEIDVHFPFMSQQSPTCFQAALVAEGLDTWARLSWNDRVFAETLNMFRWYRFDVTSMLCMESASRETSSTASSAVLKIEFLSPLQYTKEQYEKYPYHLPEDSFFNTWTEPSHRAFLRKAGADFGWDWGPALIPRGIWKDLYLEVYFEPTVVLRDFVLTQHHLDTTTPTVQMHVQVELVMHGRDEMSHALGYLNIRVNNKTMWASKVLDIRNGTHQITAEFTIRNATLWWPHGYGEAYLYDLEIEWSPKQVGVVWVNNTTTTTTTTQVLQSRFGLRTIELVESAPMQERHAGEFYFLVNQIPIFIKGSNWVPVHAFHRGRSTQALKTWLLTSARAAHMNMIRVWGGGIYEDNAFYEWCDAHGILVWQELMFACALYPRDPDFLANVEIEVTQQIKRLQRYTSIALWSGNNEVESLMNELTKRDALNLNVTCMQRDATAASESICWQRQILAIDYIKLFVDTIRDRVQSVDPTRSFIDSSPSNGLQSLTPYVKRWQNTSNPAMGDVHVYNYSADCQDIRMYPHALFISEFGFQSMPSWQTFKEVSIEEDWFWDSKLVHFRQRHALGNQQMMEQIQRHFDTTHLWNSSATFPTSAHIKQKQRQQSPKQFEALLRLTQLQQAMCYESAIQHWRRRRNPNLLKQSPLSTERPLGSTMGLLYWQLNDAWEGPSWSSIESNGRWKLLHYFIKRVYHSVMFSLASNEHADDDDLSSDAIQVYVTNDELVPLQFDRVIVQILAVDTGEIQYATELTCHVKAATTTPVFQSLNLSNWFNTAKCSQRANCFLRVIPGSYKKLGTTEESQVVNDAYWFPLAFKDMSMAFEVDVFFTLKSIKQEGNAWEYLLSIEVLEGVAYYVILDIKETTVWGSFSDNGFILVAQESPRQITFVTENPKRLTSDSFEVTCLQNLLHPRRDVMPLHPPKQRSVFSSVE